MTPNGLTAYVASRLKMRTEQVGDRERGARHPFISSLKPLALIRAEGAVVVA